MTRTQSPLTTGHGVRRISMALSTRTLRALLASATSIVVVIFALALAPAPPAQAEEPPQGRQANRADYLAGLPAWLAEAGARPAAGPEAVAATFNVTWANDELDAGPCGSITAGSGPGPDGQLSLREAICQANNSGAGPHTINVPPGTFTLSQSLGELVVSPGGNQTFTISGAGAASTIVQATNTGCPSAATCNNRVFDLDPNLVGGVNVTIQNLTIAHGRTSDAIGGAGVIAGCQTPGCGGFDSTTLSGVTFNDNLVLGASPGAVGGGIQNIGGTLIVQSSTFTNNDAGVFRGGGIYYDSHSPSVGTFTVSNSSFTGNKSGSTGSGGGAIYETAVAGSTLSITGSTFSGNQATGASAGGAAVYKDGGATLTIDHSTFVSNQVLGASATVNQASGGGINTNTGTVNVSLSRFFGNTVAVSGHGGGVWTAAGATTTATNNWWGCNAGPNTTGCDTVAGGGTNVSSPWITLTNTASPGTINVGQSTTLTASFLQNSNNGALTPSQISVLVGLPVAWGGAVHGALSSQQTAIQANGTATATFTNDNTCNNGSANATVDNAAPAGAVTVQCADLTAVKSNDVGGTTLLGSGWTWTIHVTNGGAGFAAFANGKTVLADNLPNANINYGAPSVLNASGLTGTINCGINGTYDLSCTANGAVALAAGGSFDVRFSATPSAAGAFANPRGGGSCAVDPGAAVPESNEGNNACSNSVTVIVSDLTIAKSHVGNFTQGQTGATYTIRVTNSGSGPTNGSTVQVVDTLPAGLTATGLAGAGWSCTVGTLTCTRTDVLGAGNSYPDVTLTVNVAVDAAPSVTNSAAVSGGGEANTGNDSVNDPTTIVQAFTETKCGLAANTPYSFTATMPVVITLTASGNVNCIKVQRTDSNHPNATTPIQTGHYWTISATDAGANPATGYQATLVLPQNNLPSPEVCKYPGNLGGAGWDCAATASDASSVTRGGITEFSDWAVGSNVSPTAVTLDGFSGRPADGLPVGWLLAALALLGFAGWAAVRRWQRPLAVRRAGRDRA